LISWKHSFKRLNEEYEIAKKKKQALDNLFETGRISQSTHDSFNSEIVAAITEIEKQQNDLVAKMQLKMQELESQIKTLEMLLANYEIQHVVGEIDEEIYQREINLLTIGLETAKHELDIIKEAANQLCSPVTVPVTEPSPSKESEAVQNPPIESVPTASAEVEVAPAPCPQEPAITIEEAAPEQAPTESAEAVPAEAPPAVEDTSQVIEDKPQVVEETPQEPVITVEEAAPVPEQPPVENAEVVPAETPQAAEETPQEPVITVEEAVPEQPSTESADTVPADVPQVEDTPQAIEATPQTAHPQKAPQEAQQEAVVEPIAEQSECAEEASPAEETVAESAESQEEA
jgi:hypothetical protein